MDENPLFELYNAQADVIEIQQKIDLLEKEKKQLEAKLRRFEAGEFAGSFKSTVEMFDIQAVLAKKQAELGGLISLKEEMAEKARRLERQLEAKQSSSIEKSTPIENQSESQKIKMEMYNAQTDAIQKQMEIDRLVMEKEAEKRRNDELAERVRRLEQEKEEYQLPSEIEIVVVPKTTTTLETASIDSFDSFDSFDDLPKGTVLGYVAGRNRSSFKAVSIRFKKDSSPLKTISGHVMAQETNYQQNVAQNPLPRRSPFRQVNFQNSRDLGSAGSTQPTSFPRETAIDFPATVTANRAKSEAVHHGRTVSSRPTSSARETAIDFPVVATALQWEAEAVHQERAQIHGRTPRAGAYGSPQNTHEVGRKNSSTLLPTTTATMKTESTKAKRRKNRINCSDVCMCPHFPIVFIIVMICPPFVVWGTRGRGRDLFWNIILTLLGWIPGIIHAWYIVIFKGFKDDC